MNSCSYIEIKTKTTISHKKERVNYMIQYIAIIIVGIFYLAYFAKMLGQRKRGIQTSQLGKGNKVKRTMYIEVTLSITTIVIVFVMIASIYLNTSWINNSTIRWIGILLIGAGTIVFITAMITMQDSWRAGIPQEEKLQIVTRGIYRFSRNPAFLGFDLTYIGACVAFGNAVIIVVSIIAITMMHLQIVEEERYLESVFGNDYLMYKSKVGRYM